jgi:predicted Rossmann-fold nucleotide-binding protein
VLFGGARIPEPGTPAPEALAALAPFYEEARRFARHMTELCLQGGGRRGVICTGGGPGVMEAGNRGAREAGGRSVGLNIVLPHEQAPNSYVTPELCFNFHYFALRKMHFSCARGRSASFPGASARSTRCSRR